MFGAFVSLWYKSPKAKRKLRLLCRCHDNGQTKIVPQEARFLLFETQKKKYFLKIINQIQLQKANELGHLIELSHVWAFNSMHEKVCTDIYNVTNRSSVKHYFMIAEND